jgi:hypothetical protein
MSLTRDDLKAFYRMGFENGFGTRTDMTLEEIDEWFESSYKAWRKQRKEQEARAKDADWRPDPNLPAPMFPGFKQPTKP